MIKKQQYSSDKLQSNNLRFRCDIVIVGRCLSGLALAVRAKADLIMLPKKLANVGLFWSNSQNIAKNLTSH